MEAKSVEWKREGKTSFVSNGEKELTKECTQEVDDEKVSPP